MPGLLRDGTLSSYPCPPEGEDEMLGRCARAGATALAVLSLGAGAAQAARTYPDRRGDVRGGAGPDLTEVRISDTKAAVTFRVRFATAPPLRTSTHGGWVDMLLIAVDVPPFGPQPRVPGGEWPGANYALGTHGPSATGMMVRLGTGSGTSRRVATFKIATRGTNVSFSIPRSTLGKATSFRFTVAAARELGSETGGGVDLLPATGTLLYVLTR
jgi:hypothetical protein